MTQDSRLIFVPVSPIVDASLRKIFGKEGAPVRWEVCADDDGLPLMQVRHGLVQPSSSPAIDPWVFTLSEADLPSLAEVLAFAARRGSGEMVEMSRAFGRAVRATRQNEACDTNLSAVAVDVDLVIVHGNMLTAKVVPARLRGVKAFLVTCMRSAFGGASTFDLLFGDDDYELVTSDDDAEQALFVRREILPDPLPIHFFTIVLNGMPFVTYHEKVLTTLNCRWHWHIVEGVADLVKDTAWSVEHGGRIPEGLHRDGRSIDGTSEFLDDLAARHPDRITIYRQPLGLLWDGKLAMVTAPLSTIDERCLLWQIDADELWSTQQIDSVRAEFLMEPGRTSGYFWCNYFVGPERGISTRFNYAQCPGQEWLRVWRFVPGMRWDAHEPPILVGIDPLTEQSYDVGKRNPLTHEETERIGAVFDHLAYATPEQALFKESYYGYAGAVERWRYLQQAQRGSHHLRDYFDWVGDETMFDSIDRLGWRPLARLDHETGTWRFRTDRNEPWETAPPQPATRLARIVVDGVFFQLAQTGIARFWRNLLLAWVKSGFAERIVFLDRGGTAPRLDGIIYRSIERHPLDRFAADATMLQRVCDEESAALFLSSYYTSPTRTPSVFVGHDMIPEAMGFDLSDPWWQQKRRSILQASGYTMVSINSAKELVRFYPEIDLDHVLVAYNAVDPIFFRALGDDAKSLQDFKCEHELHGDYILLVGTREGWKGYKNGVVLYAALALMHPSERPLLVCVGGEQELGFVGTLMLETGVRMLRLDDKDLRLAYAGALALVCPSFYEGFGIPIAEAMAVGCPVLTCRNTSIPEVAGDAAIYFDPRDPAELATAIRDVRRPDLRKSLIERGRQQIKKFDQDRSGEKIAAYCLAVVEAKARSPDVAATANPYATLIAQETAQARISELETELNSAKLALSDQTRFNGPVAADPGSASGRHHAEVMVLEQRLAAAMSEIAALGVMTKRIDVPPGLIGDVKVEGVGGVEGPYPDIGILRRFHWQVGESASFAFCNHRPGRAVLAIECGNIAADQNISVLFNGTFLGRADVPANGWETTLSIRVPVCLTGRTDVVEIKASSYVPTPERELYMAIYRVHFIRRKALLAEDGASDLLTIALRA